MGRERHKTDIPGVIYYEVPSRVKWTRDSNGEKVPKLERHYYIYARINGKVCEEPVGRQWEDRMTPVKVANYLAGRREGRILSPKERREAEEAEKRAEEGCWTINRLWGSYRKSRPMKGEYTDNNRFERYLKKPLGNKEARNIRLHEVDKIREQMVWARKSPQTVKHVLQLLTRIVNYGVEHEYSDPMPFSMRVIYKNVTFPTNKIENLTPDQLTRLLDAIEKDDHPQAGKLMLLALYSGMRRGEMFKLRWQDVDFHKNQIWIADPKGEKGQHIPLNEKAREVIESMPETSEFIFPGRGGGQRKNVNYHLNRIKKAAGLPKEFRALHGLRHVFASLLASSGEVDMYVLQKLMTHKSAAMTQRYAHLADEAKQRASNKIGDIVKSHTGKSDKVVNLKT